MASASAYTERSRATGTRQGQGARTAPASSASRTSRGASRSGSRSAARGTGVRWDKVGRLALLGVLVVLAYLYISAGVSLWGTWHTSGQDKATVAGLERQNVELKHERAALKRSYSIEAQARRFGMGRSNEKSFIVRHLPRD